KPHLPPEAESGAPPLPQAAAGWGLASGVDSDGDGDDDDALHATADAEANGRLGGGGGGAGPRRAAEGRRVGGGPPGARSRGTRAPALSLPCASTGGGGEGLDSLEF